MTDATDRPGSGPEDKGSRARMITPEAHPRFVRVLLEALGASAGDAQVVAEGLFWADVRALHVNGLTRLPILAKRLSRGLIRSPAAMQWSVLAPAAQRLDAGDGFGHVAGRLAMGRAIDLAKSHGVAVVAVLRSHHYGAAAYFCAQAAEAGCLGFAFTNAFPKVAPFGGKKAVLGTNPLAFGSPTASGAPMLVDFSTSAISGAEVRSAAGHGGRLPPGVAVDAEGKPTEDPADLSTGVILPAAGHKGFGLALMVEILSGVLAGAAVGTEVGSLFHTWDRPLNVGHLFMAVDIEPFMPQALFLERTAKLFESVRLCPPLEGADPIRIPGEIRARYAEAYSRGGIPIGERTAQAIDSLAESVGLKAPWTASSP